MDLEFLGSSFIQIVAGVPQTLTLVGSSLALGLILAVAVAQLRLVAFRPASALAYSYVYMFRSTPLLVQIFLIYYGSGQFRAELQAAGLWWLFREPYFCAILALTLNTGAYTSEIIRGGIQSVPLGQREAGRAVGMSPLQLFRRVVFPVAIRQALPAYGNEIILMVKSTSLASTITLLEITGISKKLMSTSFRTIEVFLVAGAIYLLLNFVVTAMIQLAEYRLSPHLRNAANSSRPAAAGRALPVR